MVAIYPYAKRFTDHPSIVLGFTLSWGVFLGCIAIGVDPRTMMREDEQRFAALASLFCSYTVYVTLIDMIYSHQDIEDDEKAVVRSMAVRYRNHPKAALMVLALLQLALLLVAGGLMSFPLSHLTSVGLIVASINGWMVYSVDLAAPGQCWWWFQCGSLMMGAALSVGWWVEVVSLT
jgi:4-hydroxybenzoate polyprenyltransferase